MRKAIVSITPAHDRVLAANMTNNNMVQRNLMEKKTSGPVKVNQTPG